MELNPGFADVCLVDGKVWLAQEVLDDIEEYTGHRPSTDCPRALAGFLHTQGILLKRPVRSEEQSRRNFIGFCLLRAIAHALDLRMHGPGFSGELPEAQLLFDAFHADSVPINLTLQ